LPENRALRDFKAELFKALAHPTRIHIVDLLRTSEKTVSELQLSLGIESSSVSQQLSVLRAKQIVAGRKEGNSVYYRVTDPNVFALLDFARQIFNNRLMDLQSIAGDEDQEEVVGGHSIS
jgi:DNA-binding transcriptional ArsR family regulator